MKTFGGFRSGDEFSTANLRGDEVHRLSSSLDSSSIHGRNAAARESANRCSSRAIEIDRSRIELMRITSEMKRTEIGAPLIWLRRRVRCWHIMA
jgi:hypothetical protein